MKQDTFTLTANDGHEIFLRKWHPPGRTKPIGVIHISHGMAEHSKRYESTAQALAKKGFHVFAHDQRGHGYSADGTLGLYADSNGWQLVISDMQTIQQHLKDEYSDLPRFLLAHSMGSFIALGYVINCDTHLSGFVLSGSNFSPPARYHALRPIIKAEKVRLGDKGRSPVVEMLTFGSYNSAFKPARTEFDWLSRDPNIVDEYNSDELCGFFCTNQLWEDLINGLISISNLKAFRKIPHDLPIYLFSGDRDPVGDQGAGVVRLANLFLRSGQLDVTTKLYHEGRHEMLNEINSDEVLADLSVWLKHKALA